MVVQQNSKTADVASAVRRRKVERAALELARSSSLPAYASALWAARKTREVRRG